MQTGCSRKVLSLIRLQTGKLLLPSPSPSKVVAVCCLPPAMFIMAKSLLDVCPPCPCIHLIFDSRYPVKTGRWAGVVTAFITMSSIKDEIDWEFPGNQTTEGQTNYFWQGVIRELAKIFPFLFTNQPRSFGYQRRYRDRPYRHIRELA